MTTLGRRIAAVVAAATLSAAALAGCSADGSGGAGSGPGNGTETAEPSASSSSSSSPSKPSPTSPSPSSPSPFSPSPSSPSPSSPSPTSSSPAKPGGSPSTPPPLTDTSMMRTGSSGPAVQRMQQRLSDLGYWLGTPDGEYGYQTSQAVMALQKTAGLGRDGVYGPATRAALERGVRPRLRVSGNAVQINLATQVLTIVEGGGIVAILNTSTGSGQQYVNGGETRTAITPRGTFSVIMQIDGLDRGPLGNLWRPKYFTGGIAVHGSASVPGYPASHGCARVSNAAMDMLWARGLMPMGRTVVVF